jgi:hypothetical protein
MEITKKADPKVFSVYHTEHPGKRFWEIVSEKNLTESKNLMTYYDAISFAERHGGNRIVDRRDIDAIPRLVKIKGINIPRIKKNILINSKKFGIKLDRLNSNCRTMDAVRAIVKQGYADVRIYKVPTFRIFADGAIEGE